MGRPSDPFYSVDKGERPGDPEGVKDPFSSLRPPGVVRPPGTEDRHKVSEGPPTQSPVEGTGP